MEVLLISSIDGLRGRISIFKILFRFTLRYDFSSNFLMINFSNFAILCSLLKIVLQKLALEQSKSFKKKKKVWDGGYTTLLFAKAFFQEDSWVLIPCSLKWNCSTHRSKLPYVLTDILVANPRTLVSSISIIL